jgi:hypothetical protein
MYPIAPPVRCADTVSAQHSAVCGRLAGFLLNTYVRLRTSALLTVDFRTAQLLRCCRRPLKRSARRQPDQIGLAPTSDQSKHRQKPRSWRQSSGAGFAFRAGRSDERRRSGRLSGFHPAMVLAHCRASSLSAIAGNSRRTTIAAANSPSRSNAARMAAASSSDTTNIGQAWEAERSGASDGISYLAAFTS